MRMGRQLSNREQNKEELAGRRMHVAQTVVPNGIIMVVSGPCAWELRYRIRSTYSATLI